MSGSPPRAWGRLGHEGQEVEARRLTPTRVGTTLSATIDESDRAAHPHARGDDKVLRSSVSAWPGSPPRAWGRLVNTAKENAPYRLTPTRVGTTRPEEGR